MKGLNWISTLTVIFGVVFIIYGWIQSLNVEAHTSEFESELMRRTVRTYVFILGGVIVLAMGISLKLIKTHLSSLENKIFELEIKTKTK
ncbi:hypothetical protein [Fredinandcohnia onubensis]|uniref:hypothetical protein n=1 Tax=Fredinandcohnia onubensis TaxID=1571209 RepID=UPI000C0BE3B3|nr:hypothetical protein [Fredinandcohnia onubensis]